MSAKTAWLLNRCEQLSALKIQQRLIRIDVLLSHLSRVVIQLDAASVFLLMYRDAHTTDWLLLGLFSETLHLLLKF